MSKTLLIAFAIGIAVIAVAVGSIFFMQRGAHLTLPGKVLKVRIAPLDDNSSVAVVDFRVTNPSDYTFMAKNVTVVLDDGSALQMEGQTSSEMDAKRLFAGIPLLGEKYNESLKERDKVPPHGTLDRMVAARFEVPESKLAARKRFIVKVEEVDGMVSELVEQKP
ncbi:MAG TPA: hypothetical protein VKB88_24225 [Bryobacteraceae bacterium]|nr:hypothetical protein [Bryobacteraceae bacterium]